MITALPTILFVFLLASNGRDQNENSQQVDEALYQTWRHSYEEDTKDIQVYRNATYEFPLGWGRTGMQFRKDATITLYEIAPNDAIIEIDGSWGTGRHNDNRYKPSSQRRPSNDRDYRIDE